MHIETTPRLADLLLHIDGFCLSELPLDRAGEYIKLLSRMLGANKEMHLVSLQNGSLQAAVKVEPSARSKTDERLYLAGRPNGGAARKAFEKLNDAIAEDGGKGHLLNIPENRVILAFPGRDEAQENLPSFWEDGAIRGKLSLLGERVDGRYSGQIRDPKSTYSFTCSEVLAHALRPHLWGTVELGGRGNWQRQTDGKWKLINFQAGSFRELQKNNLSFIRSEILNEGGFGLNNDATEILKDIR
ncbi:hypothetical protein HKD27_08845 [Gluconobacter sp. R75690]|uniref:hypothetical protein n=1 Tax=unclassified Gluconobacter TaxID=2644261 RepID=UPI00188D9F1D|nr:MULTISPECIES: hypothetical protein [unclassified Gluconobacter]MBF0851024.1 hypothetical protein [Gluconobacter sp. R75690]MBF0879716.1 hypothetical protein [Gluconobacter sp. R75828]